MQHGCQFLARLGRVVLFDVGQCPRAREFARHLDGQLLVIGAVAIDVGGDIAEEARAEDDQRGEQHSEA